MNFTKEQLASAWDEAQKTGFYFLRADGTALKAADAERVVDVWCRTCGKAQAVLVREGFPLVQDAWTDRLGCDGDRDSHQDCDAFELLRVMIPPTPEQLQ